VLLRERLTDAGGKTLKLTGGGADISDQLTEDRFTLCYEILYYSYAELKYT
jgi:hypothetical protein